MLYVSTAYQLHHSQICLWHQLLHLNKAQIWWNRHLRPKKFYTIGPRLSKLQFRPIKRPTSSSLADHFLSGTQSHPHRWSSRKWASILPVTLDIREFQYVSSSKSFHRCFQKWVDPDLFLLMFVLFKDKFYRKNCRLQQDWSSIRQSRRQASWPLDHHYHGPCFALFHTTCFLNSRIIISFLGRAFAIWDSRGIFTTLVQPIPGDENHIIHATQIPAGTPIPQGPHGPIVPSPKPTSFAVTQTPSAPQVVQNMGSTPGK